MGKECGNRNLLVVLSASDACVPSFAGSAWVAESAEPAVAASAAACQAAVVMLLPAVQASRLTSDRRRTPSKARSSTVRIWASPNTSRNGTSTSAPAPTYFRRVCLSSHWPIPSPLPHGTRLSLSFEGKTLARRVPDCCSRPAAGEPQRDPFISARTRWVGATD